VEFVPTHGGSIRVFADTGPADVMLDTLYAALERERASAWHSPSALRSFAAYPPQAKREALLRLSGLAGNVLLAGYGASAKAISLLSYLGVGTETVPFIADTTPAKWGRYTPGSHIPIRGPQQLTEADPEFVINFLWNWREESEANIRRACPGAQIVYLREQEPALQVAA
jgi:methylation protein EvaC